MPLILKVKVAKIEGEGAPEEAEELFGWLLEHPKGKLNLKHCKSLHSALVQVILALRPEISSWPENKRLAELLKATDLAIR